MDTEAVITVADARAGLSGILRSFRTQGSQAEAIAIGSHRRREAVIVPAARWDEASASAIENLTLDWLRLRSELIRRVARMNRLESVAVFGSVARGEASVDSDLDLLVDPADDATMFDLAQFAIDMEQLTRRRVDVVSRRALDERRDAAIISESIPL